ncbi:phosphoesterase, PA-phosphatase related [Thermosinus carboxydivorans Nor1]|uniref:Phosphoesterase, PA-phosphatase related n=1 Tax=Thermosinus carboxydivorans Nor1 TaxID=401526 RepID=A1HLR0_9FIRM|nr:undecaprenyl-diphosphatase [Thermosinus carboxydivorans]EAX48767.1 phosphoesterase, PA-phosphatase related [Thermosinus carboxydivorans Nor1]
MFYDNMLLKLINSFAGHWIWLDKAMMAISQYGPAVFGIYLIGLWFGGGSKDEVEQNRRRAMYAFFSALLALGINQIICHAWFRERPYVHNPVNRLLPVSEDPSFPSDHAAGAFSIAGSLMGHVVGGKALMLFAGLVALSRVYVGLHYPSDILGGMLVGLISSWIVERNKAILEKPAALLFTLWHMIEAKLPIARLEKVNNR